MAVSFDLYRTFYYVAKYENMTIAAKALFVTQPTVTHAIQTLERELGCTLFIRSSKGVSLTPEARMLYKHIAIACEHIFEAEANLNANKELASGFISIGASETTLHHFLLPYLTNFRKEYPHIKLKVSNSSTPATIAAIQAGILDFAILVMPSNYKSTNLSIIKLSEFQDILVAGRDFMELAGTSLSLNDLAQFPLVCMEKGTITRQFLDEFFFEHRVELKPDIELATSDLIVPIVENGLGIGLVPEPFARNGLHDGSLFRIHLKEHLPKRNICLIQKEGQALSIASDTFVKMLL